jgi:hypothetical protein
MYERKLLPWEGRGGGILTYRITVAFIKTKTYKGRSKIGNKSNQFGNKVGLISEQKAGEF